MAAFFGYKFVVSSEPAEGWMASIVADAERMYPGNYDREYCIATFTHIKLMVQDEHPPQNRSWWVRWVNATTEEPLAGFACNDLMTVLAAVANILERAGVPVE